MSDELPTLPPEPPPLEPAEPPPPERDPFWGYSDLFLFGGLALPAMLAGFGLVKVAFYLLRFHPIRAAEAVTQQFVGYLFLSLVLVVIFRLQYGRPFWRSLGWTRIPVPPMWVLIAGWLTAFAVVLVGFLIRTPTSSNPMMELIQENRWGMILIGVFGITMGPLAEELTFRGFLQPLLVRTAGVPGGILLAAIPFGLLHIPEYGYSWRHALLITAAGAAFGWMRQYTGSTKAATLMHAAYNALFFAALFSQGKNGPV
jgi:membrane protease YdiL (CAAX protease family)